MTENYSEDMTVDPTVEALTVHYETHEARTHEARACDCQGGKTQCSHE